MTEPGSRLTRILVRLYPGAWRDRHGDELAAIIESRPAGPSLILDVVLGAFDARLRAVRGRGSIGPELAFMAAARSMSTTLSPPTPVVPTVPVWRDVGELTGRGLSRRQLLRRSLGVAVGLSVVEAVAGFIGFLWPNLSSGFGGPVTIGDLSAVAARPAVPGTSLRNGAPAYVQEARAYIQLVDPTLPFRDGVDTDGSGATTNVRALYQRCPHLGCRPNFCPSNYWFECPCHQSRYDRLGTKVRELGPAPRSMDRFAVDVSGGVLTVDTSKMTLGPLPVALGQAGLIPSRGGTCI